jgi:hypothetical protein
MPAGRGFGAYPPISSLMLVGRQENEIDALQSHFFLFANCRDNNGDYRRRSFVPTLEEGADPVGS